MPDIILERVSVSTVSISTPIELEETYVRLRSLPEVPEMIVVPSGGVGSGTESRRKEAVCQNCCCRKICIYIQYSRFQLALGKGKASPRKRFTLGIRGIE